MERRSLARAHDGGQLLLLAGIILVLAFVITAFTLGQVADVEKQAAREQDSGFLTEYRFLHDRMGTILSGNVGRSTDNLSFTTTFATTAQGFRNTLAAKGFDSVITLASDTSGVAKRECSFQVVSPCDTPPGGKNWNGVVPTGGTRAFDHMFDQNGDGIVWVCGESDGWVAGAVVYFYLYDGKTKISETVVYATNHADYVTAMADGNACN